MGRKSGPRSISRTYLVFDDTVAKLLELEERFSLNHSDSVRRGIGFLHDYLINKTLPPLPKPKCPEPEQQEP